jgi:serine/threonine protein kinase/formylglycine-generating enzyme required for sulfatase activity
MDRPPAADVGYRPVGGFIGQRERPDRSRKLSSDRPVTEIRDTVAEVARRLELPPEAHDALFGLLVRWTNGYTPTLLPIGPVSEIREPADLPADAFEFDFDEVADAPPVPTRHAAIPAPPPAKHPSKPQDPPVSAVDPRDNGTVTWAPDPPPQTEAAAPPSPQHLTHRFIDLGLIGAGGMGEVHRVLDQDFNRLLALKIIRPELAKSPRVISRFVSEAQVTAQLQHPGIVPVHEMGRLSDGRRFFTMREIRGRDLGTVITELHEAREAGRWRPTATGWTLRRLVDAFHKVSETIAYAHSRGVIHRDIKPENVLLGDYGEALVVDWGLARILGLEDEEISESKRVITDRSQDNSKDTMHGSVAGTPAYMPIEQATGDRDRQGPWSDVYALGAVLYEILTGRAPYVGEDAEDVLRQVVQGPPEPLAENPEIPEQLRQICNRAIGREPDQRYPSARELAADVSAWLEGSKRREQALQLVAQATERSRNINRLLGRAEAVRAEAERLLATLQPTDPVEKKRMAWQHQEEARRLEHGAEILQVVVTQLASSALAQEPDLPEAHAFLAEQYQRSHALAEARGQHANAERFRILLQAHDNGRFKKYLVGHGAVTLVTDPPGAQVEIFRYVEHDRLLVPEPFGPKRTTPLKALELPMGSYLFVLSRPGHLPVRYPVHIRREEHWDGVPPREREPFPIRLPGPDELGEGEIYVPAGWFWAGADPAHPDMPRERVWCDPFVILRNPITNREYAEFVNELNRSFRNDDATRHAPGAGKIFGRFTKPLYELDRSGTYRLSNEAPMEAWDWPVVLVDWKSAGAYASWRALREGRSWWLPHELEWEKAARGVDGRAFPFGGYLDPTWAAMGESFVGKPEPVAVGAFASDDSPYGLRGAAGNVREWCRDRFHPRGPRTEGQRITSDRSPAVAGGNYRAVRGGGWASRAEDCRTTSRTAQLEEDRVADVGFRLLRPFGRAPAGLEAQAPEPSPSGGGGARLVRRNTLT